MTFRGRSFSTAPAKLAAFITTAMGTILLALALAPPSFATLIIAESFYPQGPGLAFAFRGTPQRDDVTINWGDYPIPHHVQDPGGIDVNDGCHLDPGSDTTATCDYYFGHYQGRLRAGDDEVAMTGPFGGKLYAGAGSDVISAGGGPDEIYGSRGRDVIKGGSGADLIDGGPDPDIFKGSAGDDKLRAADGVRDRVIDCGPGDDFARIDRKVDPRPQHCEQVLRVG